MTNSGHLFHFLMYLNIFYREQHSYARFYFVNMDFLNIIYAHKETFQTENLFITVSDLYGLIWFSVLMQSYLRVPCLVTIFKSVKIKAVYLWWAQITWRPSRDPIHLFNTSWWTVLRRLMLCFYFCYFEPLIFPRTYLMCIGNVWQFRMSFKLHINY